jgi:hypothetical protein
MVFSPTCAGSTPLNVTNHAEIEQKEIIFLQGMWGSKEATN